MSAFDLVASNAPGFKTTGPRAGRAPCPSCGGDNSSTLSVREADTGVVLLKCFKEGCSPAEIAASIGLDVSDLFPPRPDFHRGAGPTKRRLLSAVQALDLLESEGNFTMVAAGNLAMGLTLTDEDRKRLALTVARIRHLRDEVHA